MEQTLDLTPFTTALLEAFPEQVAFCGIQGSYGRGEAGPDSDVDLVVILEEAGVRELERYRALIASMPFAGQACGFVCARRALAVWPKFDALQLLLDTKPLYGELSPLLPPHGPGGHRPSQRCRRLHGVSRRLSRLSLSGSGGGLASGTPQGRIFRPAAGALPPYRYLPSPPPNPAGGPLPRRAGASGTGGPSGRLLRRPDGLGPKGHGGRRKTIEPHL